MEAYIHHPSMKGPTTDTARYLALLRDTARAANTAGTLTEACQQCLNAICHFTGWPVGHTYFQDPEAPSELVSRGVWHLADGPDYCAFRLITERTRFLSGVGLPGRVLKSKKPHWIRDVTHDNNFPRAKVMHDIGVRAGFAFPVMARHRVVVVLEFFAPEIIEQDQELLEVAAFVGEQLSRLAEREQMLTDLMHAMQLAEHDSTAKTRMIADVTHEIRTPLNAIIGYAEMLLMSDMTPKQHEWLEIIHKSGLDLNELVTGVLEVSRSELTRDRATDIPVRLKPFLASIRDALALKAQAAGTGITKIIGQGVPDMVMVDERRLRQILLNLVGNAVKFTKKGEIFIEVRIEKQEADRCLIRFLVRDTGIGISAEEQERIFVPFEQLEAGKAPQHQGAGLGLNISRQFAADMGSELKVKSTVGVGSSFYFDLWCDIA